MRLSRIFIDQALCAGSKVRLEPAASHYVRQVLRLKPGAMVVLFNGQKPCDFPALLTFEGKHTVCATLQAGQALSKESSLRSTIMQGLSRSDHIDWTIQKCTELGVKQIALFNAQHTQIPLKLSLLDKRLLHWRGIAIKACEQCGRNTPPAIEFFPSLVQALASAAQYDSKLLLDFDATPLKTRLAAHTAASNLAILLGPEGGLSDVEKAAAMNEGFEPTSLGPRVLRTETAAVTALAIAQTFWGDI